jgi:hypothetical protein|tara:strand:+ start:1054 stop:1278 length:225 start_codon:yes stop_codon:yes gene_type:complete
MSKFKINSSTNIIKLNNQTYIPFQLHQLPDYYQEIKLVDQFKLKGYIYIKESSLKSYNKDIHTLNKDLDYRLKR